MEVVGSEIGQKMRSAIKAKLTELGCYVDDELPDYVMVMVANKRTRAQMEEDLQLFLGDNTDLFVNWLHQVLKKLQEVTVTAVPLKTAERDKSKERSNSKERKVKEKKNKDKPKKSGLKKAKKKEKEKVHKKKEEKKHHKSKKKSKHHEMIRPNVPPLLMNIEKESEPSITDVFAGQILKNHGINMDISEDDKVVDKKPVLKEKRAILPIIDPATILPNPEPTPIEETSNNSAPVNVSPIPEQREDQLKEIDNIECKIQGLKQKLAEQLDSMSDDEDFLNIRTEAEELMNDFADDVLQEICQQPSISTPPLRPSKPTEHIQPGPESVTDSHKDQQPKDHTKDHPKDMETLPQIELKLPKRPVRERLGTREDSSKKVQESKAGQEDKRNESPERYTPEKQLVERPQKSKTRIEGPSDKDKRNSNLNDGSDKAEHSSKKLTSRVSVLDTRTPRTTCASVVRVRPRPRVNANTSSLLLKAVADAHKSLLNIPPKANPESQQVKRALVLPMRRMVDPQKIVIEVPAGDPQDDDNDRHGDSISLGGGDNEFDKMLGISDELEKEEYVPISITKKITNTDYVPSRRAEARSSSSRDDKIVIESINIHNPSIGKDKKTQFIVTMDGFNPNAFLTKKLQSEGLLTEDNVEKQTKKLSENSTDEAKEKHVVAKEKDVQVTLKEKKKEVVKAGEKMQIEEVQNTNPIPAKRLSNTSDESDTQVIIKKEDEKPVEKRKCIDLMEEESTDAMEDESTAVKKRKASPIVFDVNKKERVERARTESASSDNHVTITTTSSLHKYDALPPLSQAERKLIWCRAFPSCRYGNSCVFAHPRCKFAAACTRRNCVYSHAPNAISPVTPAPSLASHVVPAANYKTISAAGIANLCKYYPNCANAACHFYHPKPCRYGKMCVNKLECNFYHIDVPSKWKYSI